MMSNLTRRNVLAGGLALGAMGGLSGNAGAADIIKWIVGYPPGGSTDLIARLLSAPMSQKLGQTMIIDNRPGAGSSIGATALARARADGMTVGAADNGTLIINPVAYKNLQYNPDTDFRPVGMYADINILLAVSKDQPYKTIAEFMEAAKSASKPMAFASPCVGSPLHLAMERLAREAGLKLEHVSYRGMAPALNDVLAGVVPSIVIDYGVAREVIKSGDVRPLATFSAQRMAALPAVPTFGEETIPGFSAGAWQGMIVPHDTPDDIVSRLSDALGFALKDEGVKARYAELGLGMPASDPQSFAKRWQEEKAVLQPLIRDLGISL